MGKTAIISLTAMIAGQIAIAMAIMTVPVLAPQISEDINIDPSKIGLYSAAAFAGAITFTSLAGSVIARYGAIRTTQIALFLGAFGLCISLLMWIPAFIVGAFAVGMGYGVATPAASHLLARTIAPQQRGFIFSIKQSGVPIGGFLLGVTIPVIAFHYSWQYGLLSIILLLFLLILLLQTIRTLFDTGLERDRKISPAETVAAVKLAVKDSRLRPLVLSSFIYAMMQLSIFTFYVVVLVEQVNLDPVTAGTVFSIMHVGGIVGRPLLGWVSDKILPAVPLLSLVGFAIFLCGLALATLDANWPYLLLCALSLVTGIITAGWNGVYISEIARVMPSTEVGRATGGVSAFTFLGVVIGPAVFTAIIGLSGSYSAAFLVVGTIAIGPAVILFLKHHNQK
ncbi:MAG: MFS transporter [Thalassobaculaceae bacterium]